MPDEFDYLIFDGDNHLYEGTDAFTRYLPAEHRDEFFWVTDDRGRRHVVVHGRFWPYILNPTFDPIGTPGCMEAMYRRQKTKAALEASATFLEPLANRPEYMDPVARLARLDEQGIGGCFLYPTMASGIEEVCRDDIDVTYALLDGLNRYLLDVWGFDNPRMLVTPVISLADPERAVAQLRFALNHGARAVMMRCAPAPTASGPRSPGLELFDPFWGLAAEAGMVIACHAGDTGYHRYTGDWTGRYEMKPYAAKVSMSDWVFIEGRAPADFVTALIAHGAFHRHPALRVVVVENGAHWVGPLIKQIGKWSAHYPESFPGDPLACFERNVWISPFWEDDIAALASLIPLEHIVAGSDWPHPEGLAHPRDFVKGLQDFGVGDQRKIMRDNGYALAGLDPTT
jgi:predicted TIM-barrel fold metal-dependent hydrolase